MMKTKFSILIRIILASMLISGTLTVTINNNGIAAGPLYVSTTGNDSNTCLDSSFPCKTINGAIGKAASSDTIYVAVGTYTTTSENIPVVTIGKSLTLSGGWDETFTTQIGRSVIDGQDAHRSSIEVQWGYIIFLTRFVIQNGISYNMGGAISISGSTMILDDSIIQNNYSDMSGGGIYASNATLYLSNSVISGNTSYSGGGGIDNNYSDVIIENSTISGNHAGSYGGGIYLSGMGSLHTFNTTISMNTAGQDGGGIWGGYDILLKNTILAENTAVGRGPDCYLSAESDVTGGYNLFGDTSDCGFIATTGDIIGLDPQLGALQDNGGDTLTQALLPGSFAIDHGNPVGCKDHLGNLLTTDQRGITRFGRCDIGAFERQPLQPAAHQVYLPSILRLCSSFYIDDFSNPGSGWYVGDGAEVKYEYFNNEYRLLMKNTAWWAGSRAPILTSDYFLVADVRNASGIYGTYGLIFDLSSDWSQFYEFEIDLNGYYGIYRFQNDNWFALAGGYSPDIHTGIATNQLSIRRTGSQIWAYANGRLLNILQQEDFTGSRYTGVIAVSYDQPNLDIRFDNFAQYSASCGVIESDVASSSETPLINMQGFNQPSHSEGNFQRYDFGFGSPR